MKSTQNRQDSYRWSFYGGMSAACSAQVLNGMPLPKKLGFAAALATGLGIYRSVSTKSFPPASLDENRIIDMIIRTPF